MIKFDAVRKWQQDLARVFRDSIVTGRNVLAIDLLDNLHVFRAIVWHLKLLSDDRLEAFIPKTLMVKSTKYLQYSLLVDLLLRHEEEEAIQPLDLPHEVHVECWRTELDCLTRVGDDVK